MLQVSFLSISLLRLFNCAFPFVTFYMLPETVPMTTAIKIENLSKKYVIGHQNQERYTVLRDVMMHKIRGIGQRLRHPLSPNREEGETEEFWALKDINLEIKQGDRVGIIGRNGAGKSTLLKVLSRITEPTSGKIHINGQVSSLLEVGTGFHPELSGRENIYLNGAILGMGRVEIKRKFDEIVDFSGVEKFLDTPVKRYSSGMYVRLAFAVAAHLEPEILIVDEVLSVGDAQFQKKCMGKMKEVGKEGRTVLFVSHNMAAIQNLCRRCIVLDHGRVNSISDTDKAIQEYSNLNKSVKSGIGPFRTEYENFSFEEVCLENVHYGEPIITELFINNNTGDSIEYLRLGVQVFNSLLARILTITLEIPNIPQGKYKIELIAKGTNLPPGNYQIALGMGIRGTGVFYKTDFLSFEIHSTKELDSFIVARRDVLGSVPPCKFNLIKLA